MLAGRGMRERTARRRWCAGADSRARSTWPIRNYRFRSPGCVDRWTPSDQKQRWLATTLLEIEPWLRRLRGYRALPQLKVALKEEITQGKEGLVA